MVPLLIEEAILEIRDRMLRPQLNAFLELVQEQNGDLLLGVETVPPDRYYITEGVEPLLLPAIFIVPDRSVHELNWANVAMQTHSIHVAALFEEIELTRLQKKGFRYAQALFSALHDQGTENIRVLVRDVDYGPTAVSGPATDQRHFRKDVSLTCEVLHAEALR